MTSTRETAREKPSSPHTLAELAQSLQRAWAPLTALGWDQRAAALAAAAAVLRDPASDLGRRARRDLPGSTGLSPEMVEWALEVALGEIDIEVLRQLWREAQPSRPGLVPVPPRCTGAILAGNVFVASLQVIFLALLAGSPVLCKASSRDDLFPRLLVQALEQVDPRLARATAVVTFAGGDQPLEQALMSACDVLVVYGSDDTVAAVRAASPPSLRLIEHGHGFGAGFVGAEVAASEELRKTAADAFALDVAAYDQRGCLSPQLLWVEGPAANGRSFAEELHRALRQQGEKLPRGPLPPDVAAQQLQWRGVAAATGELWNGPGHAVAWLPSGEPLGGPGWRNIAVLPCDGFEAVARQLAANGQQVKCLGLAVQEGLRSKAAALVPLLVPPLAPRVCAAGSMQRPPFDGLWDGRSVLGGLLRWIDASVAP